MWVDLIEMDVWDTVVSFTPILNSHKWNNIIAVMDKVRTFF